MNNAARTRDPSIDEMLASIRRIIESGDERVSRQKAAATDVAPRSPSPHGEDDSARIAANLDPSLTYPSFDAHPAASTRDDAESDERFWPDAPGTPANDRALSATSQPDAKATSLREIAAALDEAPHGPDEIAAVEGIETAAAEPDPAPVDAIASARRRAMSLLTEAHPAVRREPVEDESDEPAAQLGANGTEEEGPEARALHAPVIATPGADMPDTAIAGADWPAATVTAAQTLAPAPEEEPTATATEDRSPASSRVETQDYFADFDEETFAAQILGDEPLHEAEAVLADVFDDRPAPSAGDLFEDQPGEARFEAAKVEAISQAAISALVSREAGSRIAASFDDLGRVVREEHLRNLDATVREMLQPMLQDWLDDNLPHIVERLVRDEIERVARGPRR